MRQKPTNPVTFVSARAGECYGSQREEYAGFDFCSASSARGGDISAVGLRLLAPDDDV